MTERTGNDGVAGPPDDGGSFAALLHGYEPPPHAAAFWAGLDDRLELTDLLSSLEPPEHAPGFWEALDARLGDEARALQAIAEAPSAGRVTVFADSAATVFDGADVDEANERIEAQTAAAGRYGHIRRPHRRRASEDERFAADERTALAPVIDLAVGRRLAIDVGRANS